MDSEECRPPQPLTGVRVIELGSLIAGPYAAGIFAQFGAEVIKVEPPDQGDPLRKWRKLYDGTSLWWYAQSRNKKSITVNLKSEEGQEIVRSLVKTATIVIENFRPGTLENWGLGWKQLSKINPKLIMVRISGYGQSGPYSSRPGFAAIAECMGGLRYVTGFPDRPPVRAGISLGDSLASLYGAIGAMMAMHHMNQNNGAGQFIDVALYESVFAVMESLVPEYGMLGHTRERSGSSLPGISPSNTYLCGDGKYVVIAGNGDGIFKRLMKAIDRHDLADDLTLARNDGRVLKSELLDEVIQAWTGKQSLDAVLHVLEAADVPAGRVYNAADIFEDPHFRDRGMIETEKLPDGTTISLPGIVPKLSGTPGQTKWVGPELGQHTSEILMSLGFEAIDIERLRKSSVI
jgi:crotonobetainyl-CoA:carnitine CoA-transferase CaiB-like acyl-CoA transferase